MNKVIDMRYGAAIKFLGRYIRKHQRNFIVFYIGWLIDMLLTISISVITGLLVDEIVYYQNIAVFLNISVLLVGMIIFSCILYFFIYAQHQYLMNVFTLDIKKDIFRHYATCDAQYRSELTTGEAITILQDYSNECLHFIIRNIIHFFNGILKLVIIAVYLFLMDWRIGAFVFIAAPINVHISTKFGEQIKTYSNSYKKTYNSYAGWLFELLPNIYKIRLWCAENKTFNDFKQQHEALFKIGIRNSISSITVNNIVALTNLLIQLMIFILAGVVIGVEYVTVGDFTIMLSLLTILIEQIKWTSSSYVDAQRRIPNIQRIKEILDTAPPFARGNCDLLIKNGSIEFNDVAFSYEKSSVIFEHVTFSVAGGTKLALVGESGRGKSTLAYMLAGFYVPTQGKISIDGQYLNTCSLKSIRKNIGLVAQDVLIFNGTIRENILLGKSDATDDEVVKACEKAGIITLVNSLPEGIDTRIGLDGRGLSGGQRQRIAIARIYVKDPPIIVFDEATASLDADTENEIFEAWTDVLKNRTAIIISHRESVLKYCDKVYRLN